MGYYLLHDPEAQRAVIFDSVSERPVNHPAFMGSEAHEQGESFMGWLRTAGLHVHKEDADLYFTNYGTADPTDPRCFTPAGIDRMIDLWREACLDGTTDYMNEAGWKYYGAFQKDVAV